MRDHMGHQEAGLNLFALCFHTTRCRPTTQIERWTDWKVCGEALEEKQFLMDRRKDDETWSSDWAYTEVFNKVDSSYCLGLHRTNSM